MKNIVFFAMLAVLVISCASNKSKDKDSSFDKPVAELNLAPGYIQTVLEITDVSNNESQRMVSATVKEVLGYGSSTNPVPTGTKIQFLLNESFSKEISNKVKSGETIITILSNEGSGMMRENETNLWKLISIQ